VNPAATGYYIILGAAIKGLHDLGEARADILLGVESAIENSFNADPVMVEAAKVFAETMVERQARR